MPGVRGMSRARPRPRIWHLSAVIALLAPLLESVEARLIPTGLLRHFCRRSWCGLFLLAAIGLGWSTRILYRPEPRDEARPSAAYDLACDRSMALDLVRDRLG